MQLVSLYDEVEINLNKSKEIGLTVKNSELGIPNEKNLAYIAAEKFYENLKYSKIPTETKVDITITKNIPAAAGIAGGSADAAAVLRGLNKIYGKPYTKEQLSKIAMSIGSDVPFCLEGGTKVCRNKGDIDLGISGLKDYKILIACGGKKESTARQYQRLDEKFNDFKDYQINVNFAETINALVKQDNELAIETMYNIFETLFEEDSKINEIKRIMYKNNARLAMLCGSGPSVFGMFDNVIDMEEAWATLEKEGINSYKCQMINFEYDI
jgi:4-diphosphocytidyl-2-C-methyl-D-erythritol kinase